MSRRPASAAGSGPGWGRGTAGPSRPQADTPGASGTPRGEQAGPLPAGASRARTAPPETSTEARAGLPAAAGLFPHAYAFSRRANSPGPRGTHPPALGATQGGRSEPPGRDGGAVRPSPSACSGPGPVARRAAVRSSSRADGRAGAGACLPARPLLSSLLLSRAPAGGFQSQQRPPPPTLTAGGSGGGGAGSAAEPGGRGGPPRDAGLRARTGSAPAALRPGRERSRARGGSARRVCGAWRPAAGWEGPPPSWGRRAVVEGSSPPLGPASPSSPRSPTAAVVGRLVSGSRVKQTRCVGRTDTAAACCARAGPLGTESPQASPSVQTPLTNSYSM